MASMFAREIARVSRAPIALVAAATVCAIAAPPSPALADERKVVYNLSTHITLGFAFTRIKINMSLNEIL